VLGDVWDISFFAFADLQLSVFKKNLRRGNPYGS
jgi:hypothetical protein